MHSAIAEESFRPITDRERQVVARLLSVPFTGRDELRQQLDFASARTIDDDGSIAFRVEGGPPARVRGRVPAEGRCFDPDGMLVSVLLHVVDGFLDELDVFRGDRKARAVPLDPASIEPILVADNT